MNRVIAAHSFLARVRIKRFSALKRKVIRLCKRRAVNFKWGLSWHTMAVLAKDTVCLTKKKKKEYYM